MSKKSGITKGRLSIMNIDRKGEMEYNNKKYKTTKFTINRGEEQCCQQNIL